MFNFLFNSSSYIDQDGSLFSLKMTYVVFVSGWSVVKRACCCMQNIQRRAVCVNYVVVNELTL